MDYEWEAIYSDGKTLTQYNEKGEANGYENIDKTKLKAFAIYGWLNESDNPNAEFHTDKKLIYRLHLESEQRLIFLRRGFKSISSSTLKEVGTSYFLMVGWQETINGKNKQSISYIYDDGHIEHAGVFAGGNVTPKSIK